MAVNKRKSFSDKKKEIDKLATDRNEQVEKYFNTPEDMKEYLHFMGKFHKYSTRNSTLIQKQFNGAEAVGSYNFWKKEGFQVQKGEKGISILVPAPLKIFERKNENSSTYVNVKQATNAEKAAIKRGEIKTKERLAYTKGSVFDVSQTNATAEDLPKIFPNKWLEGSVENYADMFQSMKKLGEKMGVQTLDEPMNELGAAKGAYIEYTKLNEEGYMEDGRGIQLNPRNSELQNVKTMIHELAHAHLHSSESKGHDRTHPEKEFQAEMTALTVASYFNLDTSDYSLQYLKSYTSSEKDINDKFGLLEEVKDTSHTFITHLENDLTPELEKENSKVSTEEVKNDFAEYEIATRDGIQSIEELNLKSFDAIFKAQDGRNILADKEFQEGTPLEKIKKFNAIEEPWSALLDNVKFIDDSQNDIQYYVEFSEKPLNSKIMNGEDMNKMLAAENLDSLVNGHAGYDKTNVKAIVPGEKDSEDVEKHNPASTIALDRIDLGDGEYHDLSSHLSYPMQGIPDTGEHLRAIYNKDTLIPALESVYAANQYEKSANNPNKSKIEDTSYKLQKVESFALQNNYLTFEDISNVKTEAQAKVDVHAEQMNTQNAMVNLKGYFETAQRVTESTSKGELTQDKLIERMEAENKYSEVKNAAVEKGFASPDSILQMESSVLNKAENQQSKSATNQPSTSDNPFKRNAAKQFNAGMSQ